MRIFLIIGMMSALAGCASRETSNPAADSVHESLAAPTPAGVALRITGADNGKAVEVGAGTMIAVELIGTPTAGYMWAVAEKPDFLDSAGEYGGPTSSAQLEPGFAGGSHWEAFAFNVTAAGEGVLRLEQRRAWEDDEPPADEFSVTLVSTE